MAFASACFASFGGLPLLALLEGQMGRWLDALLAEALVLDLLLMLNLALFLFAFEGDDLVGVELLVREQVFINKERRPRVRRGVARLLGG